MARVPQVTRTIQTTVANVLCLNIKTGEPFNEVFTLPRTYKDEKAILRAIEKRVASDEAQTALYQNVKFVSVVDTQVNETLYGMTEVDFVKYAQVLPARDTADTAEQD